MASRSSVARAESPVASPVTTNTSSDSPLDDVVARQYRRWVYPQPIENLATPAGERQHSDPALNHQLFWPDRDYTDDLDILVAGCGTNEAASIAFYNRKARVVGIDISDASLAHQQYLKDKHDLTNLELHRLPLERAATLRREFDFIASSGVIHHTADPLESTRILGQLLRRDGCFFIMLYARYGRAGVEALQTLFRMFQLKQDEASLATVKDCLKHLPPQHLIQAYQNQSTDLAYDSGIVDTFLHGRDVSYTVSDCLDLVARAGLAFQGWTLNATYHPETLLKTDSPTYQAIAKLPPAEMWAAMEILNSHNACHFFLACRQDRPVESYAIDFANPRFQEWVPRRVYNLEIVQPDPQSGKPASLKRGALVCPITDAQAVIFNQIDGKRTIGEAVGAALDAGVKADPDVVRAFSREFFQSMWRLGLVTIRLPSR